MRARHVIEGMSKHLTDAQLVAHHEGTLTDAAALEHVETCETCRKALGELRLDKTFLSPRALNSAHPDAETLARHAAHTGYAGYTDADPSEGTHADLKRHLALCRSCRSEMAALRRSLTLEPEYDAPAALIHRVKNELSPSSTRGGPRQLGRWLVQIVDKARARFTDVSPTASPPRLMAQEPGDVREAKEDYAGFADVREPRDFEALTEQIRGLAARGRRDRHDPLAAAVDNLSRARASMRAVQKLRAKPLAKPFAKPHSGDAAAERELMAQAHAAIDAALDAVLKLHEQIERSEPTLWGSQAGLPLEMQPAAFSMPEAVPAAATARPLRPPELPELDVEAGSLRVRVEARPSTKPPGVVLTVTLTSRSTGAPVQRTLVGLRRAKATPTELWTDSDGRVAFPPAHGPVTVTLHADEHHELELRLPALPV